MKRLFVLAAFGLVLFLVPASSPGGGLATGTWKLTTLAPIGNTESTQLLVKVETTAGKTVATVLAVPPSKAKAPPKAEVVSFTTTGDRVRLVFKAATEQVFQGRISKDGKKIMGVLGTDQPFTAAYMAPTEMTTIETADIGRKLGIDQLDQATAMSTAVNALLIKAQNIKGTDQKDLDQKSALQKEAAEAKKKADVEIPKLYREVIQKHSGTFASGRIALNLIQNKAMTATPEELKNWAEVASKVASEFGPIWSADSNTLIATALLNRKAADLAVQYAKIAEQNLDESCTTELQVKVLEGLVAAHKQAGSEGAIVALTERLAKLDKILDTEYLAKVPPFKGKAFAGRKAKSDRVVVMELFTGAQCPPCVAADVAFDVLEKTYEPRDLVLIQYHMHIPGPDPMTNTDTEARWKYYRDAYTAKGVPGTPTTLFNGAVKAGGGGGMAQAEAKYDAYRAVIDPLLEEPADCKVSATAKRVGDKIKIQTNISDLKKTGKDVKLRLFLLEDTVRFAGSNKLRFHHQVVRAMPGGSDGVSVMEETLKTENEVDLKGLQKTLTTYLDDYAVNTRPFPQPGRPMEFQNLRVIALVQDDVSHEILQAVQVEVVH